MSDKKKPSLWNSVTKKASGIGQSIGHKASDIGKAMTTKATEAAKQKATEVGNAMSQTADQARDKMKEKASHSVESARQQTQTWMENIYSEPQESPDIDPSYDWSMDELYHIFIGSQTASQGGTTTVMIKTGKSYQVKVPPNRAEGSNLRLKGCGLQDNDVFLILHTLTSSSFNLDRKINSLIVQSPIYDRTKIRCLEAYNRLNAGLDSEDFAALNLLDYLVSSSQLYSEIGQRYTIASQSSRLVGIEKDLESTLTVSQLDSREKETIRATYQYLRCGEAAPNLAALTQLDSLILNANLKPVLKKYYFQASVIARAMTTDIILFQQLETHPDIPAAERKRFISVYTQLRDGKEIVDLRTLESLDDWMKGVDIPRSGQAIYQLLRDRDFQLNDEFEWDDYDESYQKIKQVIQGFKDSKNPNSFTEETTVNIIDVKPGALAENAFNSVSRGGLGLLSGMPIITGVPSFLETAARVAILQVCEMDFEMKTHLGITAIPHQGSTQTISGNNWQAVGSLGTKERGISQLSGVAAYRAILMEIDGVTGLIDQVGEVDFNQGLNVLKLLTNHQDRRKIIKQLETQMYS